MKFFLLVILCSCVHSNVYRINRHERIIEISDYTVKNMQRIVFLSERKAKLLGCDKIKFIELSDQHSKVLCIEAR